MKKNISVSVIVLVAVAVGVAWWWQKHGLQGIPSNVAQDLGISVSPTPVSKAKATGTKNVSQPVSNPNDSNPTYGQLLNQYVDRMIQFDDFCHAIPGQIVVKKGTKVLIDNRGKDGKTIKLDNQTLGLEGYHYQVVTISTDRALPYNLSLDCTSVSTISKNSAVINIEATIYKR